MKDCLDMKSAYLEVAKVFFKMGCFAFGGPAVHIALMEEEIVRKRKWMSHEHFLDLMGATNLIPGPNSTEMTMHCGHERAGRIGLFIAGAAFILPAIFITGALAWLYVNFGSLPNIEPFFIGIKPAVLAIILSAILKLGKKALKNVHLYGLGILVVIATVLGVNEIFALLGAGILGGLYFSISKIDSGIKKAILPFILAPKINLFGMAFASMPLKVFLIFLKVGAVLYGSGYVLVAYLDSELVVTGLLTRQELLDAIAVGQFTPGPVLSTATFVGYQLSGFWGAIGATAGIFLPSFLFVLLLNPFIPKIRKNKFLRSFLDSVNVAAVAIMVTVLIFLSIETVVDWKSSVIVACSFALVFFVKKVSTPWIIVIGAVLGYLLAMI